jgi:hypothetical protein
VFTRAVMAAIGYPAISHDVATTGSEVSTMEDSANEPQTAQPAPPQGRWPRYAGNALIVLALLLTLGVATRLSPTAYAAGRAFGGVLGSLAVLALLEWAITRKRGANAKGWGRLVVGLLMLLLSLGKLAPAEPDQATVRAFTQGALDLQARGEQRMADFNARMGQVDLSQVISPEIIANPARHADARARLAQFRALQKERASLVQANLAEAEQYLTAQAPDESVRRGALSTFLPRKTATLAMVSKLDAAYAALADVYQETLDWAAAQAGKLSLRNGKLQLADPAQQPVLLALARRADAAQKQAEQVEQEAQAFEADRRARFDQHKQDALKILAK